MLTNMMRIGFYTLILLGVLSCGFHSRGSIPLAAPLYKLYLETKDPYGQFTRNLKEYLKISGVTLVEKPEDANAILAIVQEATSQQLLGISGTQQTRQYNLILTVTFEVRDPQGKVWVPPQVLNETRSFTIKSDQILAGSNEASNLYTQMRQAIVYDLMTRLSSTELTRLLTTHKSTPS